MGFGKFSGMGFGKFSGKFYSEPSVFNWLLPYSMDSHKYGVLMDWEGKVRCNNWVKLQKYLPRSKCKLLLALNS